MPFLWTARVSGTQAQSHGGQKVYRRFATMASPHVNEDKYRCQLNPPVRRNPPSGRIIIVPVVDIDVYE